MYIYICIYAYTVDLTKQHANIDMDMDIDVDIDMRVSENEVTAPKQLLFTGRLNIYNTRTILHMPTYSV